MFGELDLMVLDVSICMEIEHFICNKIRFVFSAI